MSQEELKLETAAEEGPNIKLVLNGGKRELDDATVPVRWFLSPEAIEKNPQYLIFFEQDQGEMDAMFDRNNGRRYICKVSEAIHFLQILSPGHHRLMVVAVKDYDKSAGELARNQLSVRGGGLFEQDINWDAAYTDYNPLISWSGSFVASCVVEFDVPAELFAKKPETRFGKLMWQWANWLYSTEPRDQCDYRKRKLISIPKIPVGLAFLVVLAAGYVIKYAAKPVRYMGIGVARAIHVLYILIASAVLLFIGYRPKPIFSEMMRAAKGSRKWSERIRKFFYSSYPGDQRDECWVLDDVFIHQLWSIKDRDMGKNGLVYISINPLYVVLAGGLIYLVIRLIVPRSEFLMTRIFVGLVLGLLTAAATSLAMYVLKKNAPARVAAAEARRTARASRMRKRSAKVAAARRAEEIWEEEAMLARLEKRKVWLSDNLGIKHAKPAVDLNEIPAPLNFGDRVVQKFHVSFWRAKAAVCKPFAH